MRSHAIRGSKSVSRFSATWPGGERVQRGPVIAKRSPGSFRCLACRSYVTGTPSGHCPRCSWVPPTAAALPPDATHPHAWTIAGIVVIAALAVSIMFAA
jgi:hypothetical protein